jgi:hypothetical protein
MTPANQMVRAASPRGRSGSSRTTNTGLPLDPGYTAASIRNCLCPLEVEFQRRGRGAAAEDWHQVDLIPDSAGIADEQHVLERVELSHRGGIGNALAVDRMVVQLHAEIARRTLERRSGTMARSTSGSGWRTTPPGSPRY